MNWFSIQSDAALIAGLVSLNISLIIALAAIIIANRKARHNFKFEFAAEDVARDLVPTVNSIRLAQSRESDDASTYGRFAQTDLVGGHRAVPITSLSSGRDRGAAPPAQCAAKKIAEAACLQ